ncbi:AAA family ATPase [Trebonia kvetii]|uniref:AAA family ATPase n=1 Tax=Trebonia kvetii TaxID=2480626 RepID=A0A6P2BRC2_9ACTN|nr:ATP-binding protein [Trebonia kvetii]TVZ01217.1 AAA family ATPase [Trebonia kvetii]
MEPDPLLESLRNAVGAMPDDVPLRLHLATMLLRSGHRDEAVRHLGAVLQREPGNAEAMRMLTSPAGVSGPPASPAANAEDPAERVRGSASPAPGPEGGPASPGPIEDVPGDRAAADAGAGNASAADGSVGKDGAAEDGAAEDRPAGRRDDATEGYDWSQAEDELRDVLPAMFVGEESVSAGLDEASAYDAEHTGLTLADVAGLDEVKKRLEAAFLAPMRNPELRKLYGKSLRGGLLLYGPPGCGKTFIARAVAGELGARFITVSFADLIDMFVGRSERNIHELFEVARRNAPCVVFLDEVDAIGQKRSQLRNTPMRSAVNQLLLELDDVASDNTGVFLLAATNHPWDVDSALRRPGRFDRTLLVLPPDGPAREGVFRFHLRDRPVAGIDLARLSRLTDGYSGADIAHICETAAESALLDSVRTGEPRLIGQADLEAAVAEVRPSLGTWFETARNVALFANEGGAYDDLVAYLRKRRLI